MSPALRRPPSYRLHKPTGQAVVTINGKDIYLGRHATPASKQLYDQTIAKWLANGRRLVPDGAERPPICVAEVILAFWKHAQEFYKESDGTPSGEAENYKRALRPLRRLFGALPAADFGPVALDQVRQAMIAAGWKRKSINRQINRIKSVFKWAVSQQLVSADVYAALESVAGLRQGKGGAEESAAVEPVEAGRVEAIKPFLSRQVRDLMNLLQLTGARAGELVKLRPIDIDTKSDEKTDYAQRVWFYRPSAHKTAHHGKARVVIFGPKARAILEPYLANRPVNAYIFSPADAEAERHAEQRDSRQTPVQPSQAERGKEAHKRRRNRPPGERYTVASLRRAIARACEQAFQMPAELREPRGKGKLAEEQLPEEVRRQRRQDRRTARRKWRDENVWHPHQLRHYTATAAETRFTLEHAQAVLGHSTPKMTREYAKSQEAKACQAMREIG